MAFCRFKLFPSRLIVNQKMAIAKRILIETESREVFTIRVNSNSEIRGFCESCATDVEMLTVDEAVTLSGLGTLDLLENIRMRNVHFRDTASGHVLVCKESLERRHLKEM